VTARIVVVVVARVDAEDDEKDAAPHVVDVFPATDVDDDASANIVVVVVVARRSAVDVVGRSGSQWWFPDLMGLGRVSVWFVWVVNGEMRGSRPRAIGPREPNRFVFSESARRDCATDGRTRTRDAVRVDAGGGRAVRCVATRGDGGGGGGATGGDRGV
jgi:hypothetical protein